LSSSSSLPSGFFATSLTVSKVELIPAGVFARVETAPAIATLAREVGTVETDILCRVGPARGTGGAAVGDDGREVPLIEEVDTEGAIEEQGLAEVGRAIAEVDEVDAPFCSLAVEEDRAVAR
jgi:hypothetical protein